MIDFFKALSDETRLRIVHLLRDGNNLCVCDLITALNLSQPFVSRHLSVLKNCGVVQDSKQGQWRYYCLSTQLQNWQWQTIQNSSCFSVHLETDLNRLNQSKTCCN